MSRRICQSGRPLGTPLGSAREARVDVFGGVAISLGAPLAHDGVPDAVVPGGVAASLAHSGGALAEVLALECHHLEILTERSDKGFILLAVFER
jgi:hypothetical protein